MSSMGKKTITICEGEGKKYAQRRQWQKMITPTRVTPDYMATSHNLLDLISESAPLSALVIDLQDRDGPSNKT